MKKISYSINIDFENDRTQATKSGERTPIYFTQSTRPGSVAEALRELATPRYSG